jgi:hypothetical protein
MFGMYILLFILDLILLRSCFICCLTWNNKGGETNERGKKNKKGKRKAMRGRRESSLVSVFSSFISFSIMFELSFKVV